MRHFLHGLATLAAAGVLGGTVHAQPAPDSVAVVHQPVVMILPVKDAGASGSKHSVGIRDLAEANRAEEPGLPDPERITLTSLYWGRVTENWSIPRGGEGRWSEGEQPAKTFPVSEADFDRLRELFRPYEGVPFECRRVITDGPYGRVVWSQTGHEDQQLNWDAGCVTGDAADVFRRWDEAVAQLKALRDGG